MAANKLMDAETFEKIREINSSSTRIIPLSSAFRKIPIDISLNASSPPPVAPVAPVAGPVASTCFPAGSLVLMADGSTKNIEDIETGDLMATVNGGITKCLELEPTILGNRKMIEFNDKSLMWSEEHAFWTRNIDTKDQWWWSYNPNMWRAEVDHGKIGGLNDNDSIWTGENVEYASINGWKSIKPKVTDEIYEYFTPLYIPRTSGAPVIINGYVVGACINEQGYDYTTINWTGLVKSKELETV